MKSLLGLAGGGSLVHLWNKTPAIIKVPAIFGAGLLAASELNIDANHSWFSNRIFGGQAAQGVAQVVDPVDTRNAMNAGKRVTGAERMVAVQYEAGDADATLKEATADAAVESEQEILAKKAKGKKLTSTEELRLNELEIKRQELRIKTAEAQSKEAEATAAKSNADVSNFVNGLILGSGNDPYAGKKFMDRMLAGPGPDLAPLPSNSSRRRAQQYAR